MSILSELQDQYRPNFQRLDVASMRNAGIVHDAVHSSQSHQDPCDFCPYDQLAKKNTVCLLLEF